MKTILCLAIAALLTPLIGQEAKIMLVDPSDSVKLRKAYQDYRESLKKWNDAKSEIAGHYTKQSGKTIEGWERVQFSTDFRLIVPDSSLAYSGITGPAGPVGPAGSSSGVVWSNGSTFVSTNADLSVAPDANTVAHKN